MSVTELTSERAGRTSVVVVALLFASADLLVKSWAQEALQDKQIDAFPIGLQLAYNPGVAFSLGGSVPSEFLILVTAVITGAIAVFAWKTVRGSTLQWRMALAAILGGAIANLVDRVPDGLVTDYLHTGWWPTFNLADIFIVGGTVFLVALDLLRMAKAQNDSEEQPTHQGAQHD